MVGNFDEDYGIGIDEFLVPMKGTVFLLVLTSVKSIIFASSTNC